jgi:hypothetical protein
MGPRCRHPPRIEYDTQRKELCSHEIIPYTQSVAQGGIKKIQGLEKKQFQSVQEGYRDILSNEKQDICAWDDFCKEKEHGVMLKMFFPFKFRGLGRLARIMPFEKLPVPKSSLYARTNPIGIKFSFL